MIRESVKVGVFLMPLFLVLYLVAGSLVGFYVLSVLWVLLCTLKGREDDNSK